MQIVGSLRMAEHYGWAPQRPF